MIVHRVCGGTCTPVEAPNGYDEAYWPECENCGTVPDHETKREDE